MGALADRAAAQEPITILGLHPRTGPYADVGRDTDRGMRLALEEVGYRVLGRPIRYITRDTETKPDVAARRAREAIRNDGARFMVGAVSSSVALAVMEVAREEQALFWTSVGADEVTGSNCNPFTFRWSVPTYDAVRSVMYALLERYPDAKRWYTITPSYVFGESLLRNVQAVAAERGLELVGNDFHPLGEREFSLYVTKAMNSRPDVLALLNFGADVVFSAQTAAQFGVKERAKLVVVWSSGLSEMRQLNAVTLDGTYFGTQFFHEAPTEVASRVNEAYLAAYGEAIGYPAMGAYIMTRLTLDGIARAQSADPVAVSQALEGYTYEGPTGPEVVRDWDHQVVKQYFLVEGKAPNEREDEWDYGDIVATGSNPVPRSESECRLA